MKRGLQGFFQEIKDPKISGILFILTGWLGAIFLEFCLGLSPFHPQPIANYLIGLGFYLPYFAIWLALIKRYQFGFLEVFCLSGLGRLIFDFFITRKILAAAAATTSALAAFLVIVIQAAITFVLFGALTMLPALHLIRQKEKGHEKPFKQYLIGLTPYFLASGVFIIWTIVLKIIFT